MQKRTHLQRSLDDKRFISYVKGVLDGSIVAGHYVQLAARRFLSYLERSDMEFRADKVELVIKFFRILKHYKGRHARKPFELEDWQTFALAGIYGFYWKETGSRVVERVYIEIARKNGKTALAGALGLYHLIADGVRGAEVDLAANSKEQAKIAFEFAGNFAEGLNTKRHENLKVLRDSILFTAGKSKMRVFAADASKLDGFGASCYILDEYHEARNTKLRDVLQSSQADRDNPLGIIITTAGFNKGGVCYEYRSGCINVLEGLEDDPALFALIYTLDKGDDWTNPSVWVKANPNLGVTVRESFLRGQVKAAKTDKTSEVGIVTKNFNVWMDSKETWIPQETIVKQTIKDTLEESLEKLGGSLYVGVDLAAVRDFTAVSYMQDVGDGTLRFFVDYYLPEESLEISPNREQYKDWQRRGFLKVTSGNVTDYDRILQDIKEVYNRYNISKISYDSWNATQFVINATAERLPMEPYSQSIGAFNKPTKELERLLLMGKAFIGNNPITRFCFSNVVLKVDHNGNQKPSKSNNENKIDGVVAMIQALGGFLSSQDGGFFIA